MRAGATLRQARIAISLSLTGIGIIAGMSACADDAGTATVDVSPTAEVARSTPTAAQASAEVVPTAMVSATPTGSGQVERTPIVIDEALMKQAREQGSVVVIVTLAIPYQPEAELSGPDAIAEQRATIGAAQDELVASLAGTQVSVVRRLELLPQLVLEVDAPALERLAASPLVQAIDENELSAPTT